MKIIRSILTNKKNVTIIKGNISAELVKVLLVTLCLAWIGSPTLLRRTITRCLDALLLPPSDTKHQSLGLFRVSFPCGQ